MFGEGLASLLARPDAPKPLLVRSTLRRDKSGRCAVDYLLALRKHKGVRLLLELIFSDDISCAAREGLLVTPVDSCRETRNGAHVDWPAGTESTLTACAP